MTDHQPEGLVYLDGELVEESRASISVFDRGFLWGDGVYEVTPSFAGTPFRLGAHLDRLYASLRYVQIDPGLSREQLEAETLRAHEANRDRLTGTAMCRIAHYVTRGPDAPSMAARDAGAATVCIMWRPVDPTWYRTAFTTGIDAMVVPTQRNAPAALEPRAKVTSRLNQIIAELDAGAYGAVSLMMDERGILAENSVANVFVVRDGHLSTPHDSHVLEGVTRSAVIAYAEQLGVPWSCADLTAYDLAQADEVFLTSSAFGALPVRSVGRFTPTAPVPGPVTAAIQQAFFAEVGVDLAALATETP